MTTKIKSPVQTEAKHLVAHVLRTLPDSLPERCDLLLELTRLLPMGSVEQKKVLDLASRHVSCQPSVESVLFDLQAA
jgi:hypothetical protein